MHLWDIVIKYSTNVPTVPLAVAKIPNGDPLPDNSGQWKKEAVGISEDEADHQIEQISKRKC